MVKRTKTRAILGVSLISTILSGLLLFNHRAFAEVTGTVNLVATIPPSCSLTTANNYLRETITPGSSKTIGTSNLKAICNDTGGFSIYAIGFSDDTLKNNYLTTPLGDTHKIATGIAANPTSSQWNMTVKQPDPAITGNYAATIENGFGSAHIIPNVYTKIASYASTTDQTIGTNLDVQFDAYIASNQVAGTYTGKVRFTLVHPTTHDNPSDYLYYDANGGEDAPEPHLGEAGQTAGSLIYTVSSSVPTRLEHVFLGWSEDRNATTADYEAGDTIAVSQPPISLYAVWRPMVIANLDIGCVVTVKLKSVANDNASFSCYDTDTKIKAILRADSLPNGFIESDSNNIAYDADSAPVYIFFDDTNSAGIMYYYSEAEIIYASRNADNICRGMTSLVDISGLSGINTSKTWYMSSLFKGDSSLSNISSLANWDTSNVRVMDYMFDGAAALNSLSSLSGWDTSSVTTMYSMFSFTSSLVDISGLSNWNTSNVQDMARMFAYSGITNLNALRAGGANGTRPNAWDTSNVTDMSSMFDGAFSLTNISGISNWDVTSVESGNFSAMFWGVDSTVTSGFSFTSSQGSINSNGDYVPSS